MRLSTWPVSAEVALLLTYSVPSWPARTLLGNISPSLAMVMRSPVAASILINAPSPGPVADARPFVLICKTYRSPAASKVRSIML